MTSYSDNSNVFLAFKVQHSSFLFPNTLTIHKWCHEGNKSNIKIVLHTKIVSAIKRIFMIKNFHEYTELYEMIKDDFISIFAIKDFRICRHKRNR